MNQYSYNNTPSAVPLIGVMIFWTGLWLVILSFQPDPMTEGDLKMVWSFVIGLNVILLYLYVLRRWQGIYIDAEGTLIANSTKFLIPLRYRVDPKSVERIVLDVVAIGVDLTAQSKKEKVVAFRETAQKMANEILAKDEDPLDKKIKGLFKSFKRPSQGVMALRGFRCYQGDRLVLRAEIDRKKEAGQLFKKLTFKKAKLEYKMKWQ